MSTGDGEDISRKHTLFHLILATILRAGNIFSSSLKVWKQRLKDQMICPTSQSRKWQSWFQTGWLSTFGVCLGLRHCLDGGKRYVWRPILCTKHCRFYIFHLKRQVIGFRHCHTCLPDSEAFEAQICLCGQGCLARSRVKLELILPCFKAWAAASSAQPAWYLKTTKTMASMYKWGNWGLKYSGLPKVIVQGLETTSLAHKSPLLVWYALFKKIYLF